MDSGSTIAQRGAWWDHSQIAQPDHDNSDMTANAFHNITQVETSLGHEHWSCKKFFENFFALGAITAHTPAQTL